MGFVLGCCCCLPELGFKKNVGHSSYLKKIFFSKQLYKIGIYFVRFSSCNLIIRVDYQIALYLYISDFNIKLSSLIKRIKE